MTCTHETLWTLAVEYHLGMEDPEPGSRRVSVDVVGRYETEAELDAAAESLSFDREDEFTVLVSSAPQQVLDERAKEREAENRKRMLTDDCPF